MNPISLIGYASGAGARDSDCALGPQLLYNHPEYFDSISVPVLWHQIIQNPYPKYRQLEAAFCIQMLNAKLAFEVEHLIKQNHKVCVIGGDHSSALGTWSGVAAAHRHEGDIGLIWIDAHLDSHNPETSLTKNIHGMPAAHLLGDGIQGLATLMDDLPKIKPENLCFIGARSYEEAELALVRKHNVKIYFMEEVLERGIQAVLVDAIEHLSKTCGIGFSIDLDAFDPINAPGVDYRAPQGIIPADLLTAMPIVLKNQKVLALEIVEYNPMKDKDNLTVKLIPQLIEAIYGETT